MNTLHSLFLLLLLSLSSFSVTPSAAQSFSTSITTIPPPVPGVDNSTTSPNATTTTASTATYANITTTDAQGSTIVTSIPITVAPSTTPTTASSTPWPSLTGYPTCVTDCLTHAVAQVNCTSIVAVACYCTNQTFPNELYNCVASSCGTNVPSAENLAQQFCAIDNVTLTFSATAAPSTSTPSTAPSAIGTASTSLGSFNAAPAAQRMPDARGWTGMALAACGAVFGAALL